MRPSEPTWRNPCIVPVTDDGHHREQSHRREAFDAVAFGFAEADDQHCQSTEPHGHRRHVQHRHQHAEVVPSARRTVASIGRRDSDDDETDDQHQLATMWLDCGERVASRTAAVNAMATARTTQATPMVVSNTARQAEPSVMTPSDRPAVYPTSSGMASSAGHGADRGRAPMTTR